MKLQKYILLLSLIFCWTLYSITDQDIMRNRISDEEIYQLVQSNPDYLNKDISQGNTILHYAMAYKRYDLAKNLVLKGADINRETLEHDTPIMYACLHGNKEMFDWLIEHGAKISDPNDINNLTLNYAIIGGNLDILEELLKQSYSINVYFTNGLTPLHQASYQNKEQLVDFLLENGADVNAKTNNNYQATPLQLAIFANNQRIIQKLLTKNPDLYIKDAQGSDAILYAINLNHTEILQMFLNNIGQINNSGNTWEDLYLHQACRSNAQMVQMLINSGSDINKKSEAGDTPLMFSLQSDSLDAFNMLIKAGADIHAINNSGKNAVFMTCESNKIEALKILLGQNPEINIIDQKSQTPLIVASMKGYEEIVALLIEHHANIEHKDHAQMSAYDYAIKYKNLRIAQLLLPDKIKKDKTKYYEDLAKNLRSNEMLIYYTGNSGFIIQFKDTYYIFDYYAQLPFSDEPSLDNAFISSEFLKDKKVFVFVSHEHSDHFDPLITDWQKSNPSIEYYFGFDPNTFQTFTNHPFELPKYNILKADTTYAFSDLKINTFKSPIDGGLGFVIQTEDFKLLHPGDALYMNNDWPNSYTQSIDRISEKIKDIDLAFIPVVGCGFNNTEALNKSNQYLIKSFNPKFAIPMHGTGREESYYQFKEQMKQETPKLKVMILENKGDHLILKM